MRATLLALTFLGCTGSAGPSGPQGAPGAAGPQGEPGASGARGAPGPALQWVDATGAVIGPALAITDSAGVRWPLDPETGELDETPRPVVMLEGTDCSSASVYALNLLPRVAARIGTRWLVRGDTTQSTLARPTAISTGPGRCDLWNAPARVVRVADLLEVSPPAAHFAPPLRQQITDP